MYNIRTSLANYLTGADLVLANAREQADIAAALAAVGYDAAVLQVGRGLLTTAQELYNAQIKEYGEQFAATQDLTAAWQAADKPYRRHHRFAGLAFKDDPERRKTLALDERRKRTFTGWLDQAQRFYTNALGDPAAISALARFHLTSADLAAGQTLVLQVTTLNQAQKREMAEAQRATQARDAAIEALDDWLADFRAVARLALEDDPQLLEALQLGAIP